MTQWLLVLLRHCKNMDIITEIKKKKTIPVVGVDVIQAAKEFIEKGYMLGL